MLIYRLSIIFTIISPTPNCQPTPFSRLQCCVFKNCTVAGPLYKILLGDIASREVPDPIHRHNPNILDGAQQVLEGDEVAPHPRLVGGLDLVVEVVEDDVVDVLVPAQDLGDLPKPPFSHFHPKEDRSGHKNGSCK